MLAVCYVEVISFLGTTSILFTREIPMVALNEDRKTGMDALFQYTGAGVQFITGAVFYIITARIFSTTDVGAIALFVALVGLFNLVFSFGLNIAAQHFVSYYIGKNDPGSANKAVKQIVKLGLVLSLIGSISLFVGSKEISYVFFHVPYYSYFIKLLSLDLAGYTLFNILNGVLLGLQNFRSSAIVNISVWSLYYFGAIALSLLFTDLFYVIIGWIAGMSTGLLVEILLVVKAIRNPLETKEKIPSQTILRYSVPVLFSSVILYGANFADRFIVAGLLNLSQLAIYNFAMLIASSMLIVAAPFSNILLPKFSEWYASGRIDTIKSNFKISTLLLYSIFVPSALGIVALSPLILRTIAGKSYVSGSYPLDMVVLAISIFIEEYIITQSIAAIKKPKILVVSSTVSLLSNVAFSFLLIPYYGIMGAAFGFSSVFGTTFAVLYYYGRKFDLISHDKVALLKVWVSSLAMFSIVYFLAQEAGLPNVFLIFYIGIGAIVYIFCIKMLNVFTEENKHLLYSLFPERNKIISRILSILIS